MPGSQRSVLPKEPPRSLRSRESIIHRPNNDPVFYTQGRCVFSRSNFHRLFANKLVLSRSRYQCESSAGLLRIEVELAKNTFFFLVIIVLSTSVAYSVSKEMIRYRQMSLLQQQMRATENI
jgi:hypothetical protein